MTMRRPLLVFLFALIAGVLVAEQPARKAWLGMGLVLRKGPDAKPFVYVAAVPPGTPAAKAGMAAGDVITAIDRKPIAFRDDLDLMEFVASLKPGQIVRFQVTRAGKGRTISLKAGELPADYEARTRESMERARAARASRDAQRH